MEVKSYAKATVDSKGWTGFPYFAGDIKDTEVRNEFEVNARNLVESMQLAKAAGDDEMAAELKKEIDNLLGNPDATDLMEKILSEAGIKEDE